MIHSILNTTIIAIDFSVRLYLYVQVIGSDRIGSDRIGSDRIGES